MQISVNKSNKTPPFEKKKVQVYRMVLDASNWRIAFPINILFRLQSQEVNVIMAAFSLLLLQLIIIGTHCMNTAT